MEHTPTAIGGEMEGWVLLELKKDLKGQHKKDIGVIVIKGVVDYGTVSKGDKWQWTAAKAAMDCIHYCLEKTGGKEFNGAPMKADPTPPKPESNEDNALVKIMAVLGEAQSGDKGEVEQFGRRIRYKAEWRVHSFNEPLVWDATAQDVETGIRVKVKHQDSAMYANQLAIKKLLDELKSRGILPGSN